MSSEKYKGELPEEQSPLPNFPVQMYEISGQDQISTHSVERYYKDKEQDVAIAEAAAHVLTREKFDKESLEKQAEIVTELLSRPCSDIEWSVLLYGIACLQPATYYRKDKAPTEQYFSKVEEAISNRVASNLESDDFEVQMETFGLVYATRNLDLYRTVYQQTLQKDFRLAFESIQTLADSIFKHNAPEVLPVLKEWQMFQPEIIERIQEEFAHPETVQPELVLGVLKTLSVVDMCCGQFKLPTLSSTELESFNQNLTQFIEQGLQNLDESVQLRAANLIKAVFDFSRLPDFGIKFVKQGLAHTNPRVQGVVTNLLTTVKGLYDINTSEILKNVAQKIESAFRDQSREVQEEGLRMFEHCGNKLDNYTEIVLAGLRSPYRDIQCEILKIYSRHAQREWLFSNNEEILAEIKNQKLENEFVQSGLYTRNVLDDKIFSRQIFHKTGSELTLVGGELKGKAVVRTINPQAFVTWQKLYEDHAFWKSFGFDYVPIEPIISYRLTSDGMVEVFSGVLDLDALSWMRKTPLYTEEIRDQQEKIDDRIRMYQVDHGHQHSANFCLRFFRKADGTVDLDQVPRVYLIDFDRAELQG